MRTRYITLVLIILFLTICTTTSVKANDDNQSILLNFYAQQLVAHGAELFAATTATFTFITKFIDKATKGDKWRKIVYILISGVLFSSSIFLSFRIFYYGYLCSGVIVFPDENIVFPEFLQNNSTLAAYKKNIDDYVFSEKGYNNKSYNMTSIIRNFLSHLNFPDNFDDPSNGLFIAMNWGFLLACIVFFAFSNSWNRDDSKFWLIYFSLPSIIVLIISFITNYNDRLPSWMLCGSILMICYYIVGIYVYYTLKILSDGLKRYIRDKLSLIMCHKKS